MQRKNRTTAAAVLVALMLIVVSVSYSQSRTLHLSVTNRQSEALAGVPVSVYQLIDSSWTLIANGLTGDGGHLLLDLTLTDVEEVPPSSSPLFVLNGSRAVNRSGKAVSADVAYYDVTGRKMSRGKMTMAPGSNELTPLLKGKANGLYVRTITVEGKTIGQKIIKTSSAGYSYSPKVKSVKLTGTGRLSKDKPVTADSAELLVVLNGLEATQRLAGFYADSSRLSIVSTTPQNIYLERELRRVVGYYSITVTCLNNLAEAQTGKQMVLQYKNQEERDTTVNLISDSLARITIEVNTTDTLATLIFPPDTNNLPMKTIIPTPSTLNENLAINKKIWDDTVPYGQWIITPEMPINLKQLQTTQQNKQLLLIYFKRKYQTNQYIDNGIYDLYKNNRNDIFIAGGPQGGNSTWTSEYVDSLIIITSNTNQDAQYPVVTQHYLTNRDTVLQYLDKLVTLQNTSLQQLQRIKGITWHAINDTTETIWNNTELTRVIQQYDAYNYILAYFGIQNGNSQTLDDQYRIAAGDVRYAQPTPANIISEMAGAIYCLTDPANDMYTVGGVFFAMTPDLRYENTVYTEAAFGIATIKTLLPQNYPIITQQEYPKQYLKHFPKE
jgi:hypothetical protein